MKASPLCLLLLLASVSSSCIVVAAGVGAAATYGYISHTKNISSREFDARPDLTWKAVLHGMKAQDYQVEGSPQLGPIDGVAISGDTVVTVERVPGGTSRVKVQVGTFESDQHQRLALNFGGEFRAVREFITGIHICKKHIILRCFQ